jgi:hypothetical protein
MQLISVILEKLLEPTTIIAVLALYIAYQQYRIERNNHIHALFEKRMRIYEICRDLIDHINNNPNAKNFDMETIYMAVHESRFLFGKDVLLYIIELKNRALKLNELFDDYEKKVGRGKKKARIEFRKAQWWFAGQDEMRQIVEGKEDKDPKIIQVFKPYLKIG